MEIRIATSTDLPEIVNVLRQSLGESNLPKSEEIWRYKHFLNPFGTSIVLVAFMDQRIVGVRAFMRWKWQYGDALFSGLRAVDTATLPEYRGKGIFKRLTLNAVEIAAGGGDHFVFNTPNNQSMPGYLKMGWKKVDKLSVQLIPVNPFHWNGTKEFQYDTEMKISPIMLNDVISTYNQRLSTEKKQLFTPKSFEYLEWRYFKNSLQKYQIYADAVLFISGYVRIRKQLKELRITESIYLDEISRIKTRGIIMSWARRFGVQVISISASSGVFPRKLFSYSGNFGPILTIRDLNMSKETRDELLVMDNWNNTLGDLELF